MSSRSTGPGAIVSYYHLTFSPPRWPSDWRVNLFMTFALAGMMQVFRQVPLRDFVPAQPSSNNSIYFEVKINGTNTNRWVSKGSENKPICSDCAILLSIAENYAKGNLRGK